MSLNDIADHFRMAYRKEITIYFIKKIIKKCKARARKLNRFYDSLVSGQLDVIEFDEVYQGREGKVIGGVHKGSLYLIAMERFQNKSIEELKRILMPIAERLKDIKVIITDLLPAYKTVIRNVFKDVIHQNCSIHALKDIRKEQAPINSAANRAYKKLKKLKDKLKGLLDKLKKKRKMLRYLEKQLAKKTKDRDKYYQLNNIRLYSKTSDPGKIRLKFKRQLNNLRSDIRNLRQTISNIDDKIMEIRHNISGLELNYKEKLVKRLQTGRLVKKFKDLIYANPDDFKEKFEKLNLLLKRKRSRFAKFIHKFIKNNPNIFSIKQSEFSNKIPSNKLNTNSIESIFGRYRYFLDKFRTITGSEYQESVFEILRLRHNFSKPYTGPRRSTSPLERLNIHSQYNNYLDALFMVKNT